MNQKAKIYYYTLTDEMRKEEKLDWFAENKFEKIPFEHIQPDKNGNWIDIPDNDWEELIPVANKETKSQDNKHHKTIFSLFSNGLMTDRDEWVYDKDQKILVEKIKYFLDIYNSNLNNDKYDLRIKWSETLKSYFKKKRTSEYSRKFLSSALYRPFNKVNYYSDVLLTDRLTNLHFNTFGSNLNKNNIIISFTGLSSTADFSCLGTNIIYDRNFYHHIPQYLPLYRYDESGNRHENITDWGLEQFRLRYTAINNEELRINNKKSSGGHSERSEESKGASGEKSNEDWILRSTQNDENGGELTTDNRQLITKEDIFYYTYGVLHNPEYRKKYELNLKREFPRLPFYDNFWDWRDWGKSLMDLHINFEQAEKYPLKVIDNDYDKDHAPKAKLKADKEHGIITLDEKTYITGIPHEAWEYKLGNRSALEWILDQYKEKKPRDPTIREKFNSYKFADYKKKVIELILRVCTVSVETVRIVAQMKK